MKGSVLLDGVSVEQERIFMLEPADAKSYAGAQVMAVRIAGPLDTALLNQCFNDIVRRHSVLRSTFRVADGKLDRTVHDGVFIDFEFLDLALLPEFEWHEEILRQAADELSRPFDMANGPLVRACLVRFGRGMHMLLVTLHRGIFDRESARGLLHELAATYERLSGDREAKASEPTFQLSDFANQQRRWLESTGLAAHLPAWKETLSGELPVLQLHTDHPRPPVYGLQTGTLSRELDPSLADALRALSEREGVSLFDTLLAAFSVLLQRYSGQPEILIGTPVSGRSHPESHGLLGRFEYPLALRVRPAAAPSFRALLKDTASVVAAAKAAQDLPFSSLLKALAPKPDQSRHPLFQAAFELHEASAEPVSVRGLTFTLLLLDEVQPSIPGVDLALSARSSAEGLTVTFGYNVNLFEVETIERMVDHFETLLGCAAEEPDRRGSHLALLPPSEQRRLLFDWNDTQAEFSSDATIHDLIAAQVERRPDSIAVSFEGRTMSYFELNRRANQLARRLRSMGVGPDVLVGVCVERSPEMIVGVVGVLKAGGAFIPLDPSYPKDRLAFMIEDSGIKILLTQQKLQADLRSFGCELISLDTWDAMARESSENFASGAVARNLAYVIYTSGSTGKPKGVLVEHRGLCNLTEVHLRAFNVQPDTRLLQFARFSFDASVWEIFTALRGGATLVLAPTEALLPGPDLDRLLRQQRVHIALLPPSVLTVLPSAELSSLKTLISGGEACTAELVARWSPNRRLWNAYGPTEITVYATIENCADDGRRPPIGKPIANMQVYVLDRYLQPVPIGVPGELCVGGVGVARGYLNRQELTAERFVPNPFSSEPGERMYRTGDLVRWLPDGRIDYLGRIDQQVKVRGFRIELEEIEAVLSRHPAVRDVVVLVRGDDLAEKRIVAYLTLKEEYAPTLAELRGFLREKLPSFMIPSAIVTLASFPMTPSGKVDRKALPEPTRACVEPEGGGARTSTEETLAKLWGKALGLSKIDNDDNFIELGGHSLLAARVLAQVREQFQVNVPLRALFTSPTLSDFAKEVELARRSSMRESMQPIRKVMRDKPLPLSFSQQQVWLVLQVEPNVPFYNEPATVRMPGQIDEAILEQSLKAILSRHEILRTTFTAARGYPAQIIGPAPPFSLTSVSLGHLPEPEREAEALRLATEDARRPFNLAVGPMIRAMLVRLGDGDNRLYLTMHHLVIDGVSLYTVLLKEIAVLYKAFAAGAPSPLPDLPIQYADYAFWQRKTCTVEALEPHIAYWDKKLADLPVLDLPTDRYRPAVQAFRGSKHNFVMPRELVDELTALGRREGVTLFITLLAAFKMLLYRYAVQDDIVVGTVTSGRERAELQGLMGFFLNTLVLRTSLAGEPTYRELLGRVKEVTLEAYAHQEVPFEMLVQELQLSRSRSQNPVFQVAFVLEPPLPELDVPWTISQQDIDTGTTKFDLSFELDERPDGIHVRVEYDTDLFDAATIERMSAHYQSTLESVVKNPEQRISAVQFLTDGEKKALASWSGPLTAFEDEPCLHELFGRQAALRPDQPAVAFESRGLTYRELDRMSTRLANYLRRLGVEPNALVGLFVERSTAMAIGVLGILKAGGAYVPLDLDSPPMRLASMIEDCRPRVIVTQQKLADKLAGFGIKMVFLDTDWTAIAQEEPTYVPTGVGPDSLAYVMYTPGAAGTLKGVMITHRSVVRLFRATRPMLGFGAEDVWTMFHSYTLDFSVWEMWGALLFGGKLVIVPYNVSRSPEEFYYLLRLHKVTILNLIPSAFRYLIQIEEAGEVDFCDLNLRLICLGGEVLDFRLLKDWMTRHGDQEPRIFNLYGFTSGTVFTTIRRTMLADLGDARGSRIGVPLSDVEVRILDKQLNPVPIGVAGELCVGGAGLARGFLNKPELTAESFVKNPYSADPDARLFKTGDRVRYLSDGDIEFLGRVDEQIKLRGFPIEPREVQAVLVQHPDVREAAVVVREDTPGDPRLVAYYVKRGQRTPTTNEFRAFLKEHLPDYMVPSIYCAIPVLTYISSGKVDRRSLPAPDRNRPSLMPIFRLPTNAVEVLLLGIWTRQLQVDQIGVRDDFFSLGGHSLLAAQMIARVRETFRIDVRHSSYLMREFMENPTISGLAEAVDTVREATPTVRGRRGSIDFSTEAILDSSISFDVPVSERWADPAGILLTGASGFLGAFLLHELLHRTRADIYCLVRAPNVEAARERIRKNLMDNLVWEEELSSRIIPVPGDLSQLFLKLSPDEFSDLARKVDVIYHNGAMVNFIYPYSALKPTNVHGTREIIRLATQYKMKPVHYVSTLAVLAGFGFTGAKRVGEDEPMTHPEWLFMGYPESKWVAEKLIMMATQRGLPAAIYRSQNVSGHTVTGVWNKEGDFLCNVLKATAELGSAPDIKLPLDLVPVDYTSKAIAHIGGRELPSGKVYHLNNPHYALLSAMVDRMRLAGYKARWLPYHEWVQRLVDHTARYSGNPIAPFVPLFVERWSDDQVSLPEMYCKDRLPDYDCKNTLRALEGTDITCPPVDEALLDKYLDYFIRTGFFPRPNS